MYIWFWPTLVLCDSCTHVVCCAYITPVADLSCLVKEWKRKLNSYDGIAEWNLITSKTHLLCAGLYLFYRKRNGCGSWHLFVIV